uniref:C-type lectin domain-containing protein n=1 Tax=Panagrolaimus sp. PS1159 TaxID=55785 RepID=A0AC35GRD2_9BILA
MKNILSCLLSFYFLTTIFCLCPNGSIEFQNFCYFFYPNATQFFNAELTCNGLNGHLASIHDGFINTFITTESSNYFHDSTTSDFWIGLNSLMSLGNWTWIDNTTSDFNNWAPSEPQNLTQHCAAVTIANSYWTSADCFKTKPFVCEISATPTYPAYINCSEGWIYFEPTHSCYGHDGYGYIVGNRTYGETYCERFKAHLPSIHSYEETKFLLTIAGFFDHAFWTGLISDDNEVTWEWSDKSNVDYLPWGKGYPNRKISSCAGLVYTELLFDDDCTVTHPIICKKSAFS